ncbi:MAG: Fic family protein [Desulfuromonadales bacterium]|nr:Fic family protein [Desulfuromonadales bacterium]
MEPMLPSGSGNLEDLAREVVSRSAAMGGQLHPRSQEGVANLLRLINSYYSNMIEGNSTHPVDIERAMRDDYSSDPTKRNLQIESLAHIKCQKQIYGWLQDDPGLDSSDPAVIRRIHCVFYSELPDSLKKVKHAETDEIIDVVGGELRHRDIKVGSHIGPSHATVPQFMQRFFDVYRRDRHHGVMPVIAAAAAHHRLMWIHPFLDGNGRVTRLYTDACLQSVPVLGYGLWNVSRGLARNRDRYMDALGWADAQRQGDTDGRGNLSNKGLIRFCCFFLEICLDQIDYMHQLLRLDAILERLMGYARMRAEKIIPTPTPRHTGMKPEAGKILQEVLLRGEMTRGDAASASGLGRSGRDVLAQLLDEELLVSSMPKGLVRVNFPTHISTYLFPDLYPTQMLS